MIFCQKSLVTLLAFTNENPEIERAILEIERALNAEKDTLSSRKNLIEI